MSTFTAGEVVQRRKATSKGAYPKFTVLATFVERTPLASPVDRLVLRNDTTGNLLLGYADDYIQPGFLVGNTYHSHSGRTWTVIHVWPSGKAVGVPADHDEEHILVMEPGLWKEVT